MSVTNDAENIVKWAIENRFAKNKKIYYIDTENRVDELEHNEKEFIGFKRGYDNIDKFRIHLMDEI